MRLNLRIKVQLAQRMHFLQKETDNLLLGRPTIQIFDIVIIMSV